MANCVPISGILNRSSSSLERAAYTTLDGLGLLGLKPDLVDLTTQEVWEIKTTRGYWQGRAQLSLYLAILNGFRPPLSPLWKIGTSYTPPDKAKGLLRDATVYAPNEGVILYEPLLTDDALALGAMTAGNCDFN